MYTNYMYIGCRRMPKPHICRFTGQLDRAKIDIVRKENEVVHLKKKITDMEVR